MSFYSFVGLGIGSGALDQAPNAVNWADIVSFATENDYYTNAAQEITGIDTAITLQASWAGGTVGEAYVNAGLADSGTSPLTFSVSQGDDVHFRMQAYALTTVAVTNQSDGGTTLDTFDVDLQPPP